MLKFKAIFYYRENEEYRIMEEVRDTERACENWLNAQKEYCEKNNIYVICGYIERIEAKKFF